MIPITQRDNQVYKVGIAITEATNIAAVEYGRVSVFLFYNFKNIIVLGALPILSSTENKIPNSRQQLGTSQCNFNFTMLH